MRYTNDMEIVPENKDEEDFLENGYVDIRVNSSVIKEFLEEIYLKWGKSDESEFLEFLENIFMGKDEVGYHCHREFHSNTKRCVCPICGGTVSLT